MLFDLKFNGNQERMLKTQLMDEREGGNNGGGGQGAQDCLKPAVRKASGSAVEL